MIVSLPGTTRLGDWAANLSVHYEPMEEKHVDMAWQLTGEERVSNLADCHSLQRVYNYKPDIGSTWTWPGSSPARSG